MTAETATFLLRVLGTVTLQAGADDFEEVAGQVIRARRELAEVVKGR